MKSYIAKLVKTVEDRDAVSFSLQTTAEQYAAMLDGAVKNASPSRLPYHDEISRGSSSS